MFNIILLEPEIPFNTGAIGRTCVATDTALHLIKPLGFSLDDKMVKRSGLDYWDKLKYFVYENLEDFYLKNPQANIYFATTKAQRTYDEISYKPNDYIMFGKESKGIPEEILIKNKENSVRIPMWGEIRSLNLSNSVSIVLYEALRQQNFSQMEKFGKLHRLHWEDN